MHRVLKKKKKKIQEYDKYVIFFYRYLPLVFIELKQLIEIPHPISKVRKKKNLIIELSKEFKKKFKTIYFCSVLYQVPVYMYMYNYRHEFYEYQRNRESLHRYINTCTNTNWYLVTCQGWGTKTVVVGACVVCTHAQSDPENKLHKTKI